MSRLLVTTCIALLACLVFVRSEVTVENGAYGNVLVSFSQNVPSNKGKILLDKLQDHLHETSSLLRDAVNLGISKVTFVIPRTWNTSEWNLTVKPLLGEIVTKADIVVDDAQDSVFGNFPSAQQHGSCGTPGARIVVPSTFLTEKNSFLKGTALAREWLKYRYGVFDENGYPGDELYPQYYNVPGGDPTDLTVTGCTNTPVVYNFIDNNGNNCTPSTELENRDGCRAVPEEESLENITSSLMYFHEQIINLKHVCGKEAEHPHSFRSRNKHNSLCSGQSVWDVLKRSGDLKDSNFFMSETESEDKYNIEFNYVQEPKPRVVIAWEKILNMKNQGENALKTVRKFLYDLPVGSKYALFPYTENIPTDRDYSLRELNNWPDDWKIDQIASDYVSENEGCVNCAIKKALDILASDFPHESAEPVGTAVVIASSNLERDNDLLQRLQSSKVCLMLVVFSKDTTPDEYINYAAASPCGTLVELSQDDDMTIVFKKLFEAMENILPETVGDKITQTVTTEDNQSDSPISFTVDKETADKVTFWIVREESFRHTEKEYVKVKINDKIVDLTDDQTFDISSFSFSPKESGKVEFKLPAVLKSIVQVRVTSKPGKYISGEVISHDLTEKEAKEQMPVILYVRVRFGPYPVQNAEVLAVITRPNEKAVILKMYDDGSGDPDITGNDGIYSRYFVDFTEKGEYKVIVAVRSNGNATIAGKLNKRGGYESCCGSKLEMGTVQLPKFIKAFKTTFNAISGPPKLGYQPSRIVDLRVDNVTDDKIVLKWTAPGADADKGTVASYDIKYFTTEEDLLKFENGKSLNSDIIPQERGGQETFEVKYSDFENSMLTYIAIKSKNANETTSDASNIIEIIIPDTETKTTKEPDDKNKKDDVSKGSTNKKTVGIVIGIILGIIVIVIIIYAIVYFTVVKPKRKQEKKEARENPVNKIANSTSQSQQLNPINSVSVDTLIRHHNEKERAKSQNKPQPIFKEEDFEDRAETKNKNTEQPEYTEVQRDSRNAEVMPSKPPKRTSNV